MPVLARRGTAMDELVRDGYNGYLFSSVDELPGLIGKIMQSYKEMSQNTSKADFTYNLILPTLTKVPLILYLN